MFDLSVIDGIKTVGAFIKYKNTVAMMIKPYGAGRKVDIVRFGGHIEDNETVFQCLEREVREEASISVRLINCRKTYYKRTWMDKAYFNIEGKLPFEVSPLIIKGNRESSTIVFLAQAEEEPKPSSEASGVIFLRKSDIKKVCTKSMTLRDFLNGGGKLSQQRYIDYNMEIHAGVHLRFLHELINDKGKLIENDIFGEL